MNEMILAERIGKIESELHNLQEAIGTNFTSYFNFKPCHDSVQLIHISHLHEAETRIKELEQENAELVKKNEAIDEAWNLYSTFLKEKYPAENWEFTCPYHKKIDAILHGEN